MATHYLLETATASILSAVQELCIKLEDRDRTTSLALSEMQEALDEIKTSMFKSQFELNLARMKELAEALSFGSEFKKLLDRHPYEQFFVTHDRKLLTKKELDEYLPKGVDVASVTVPNTVFKISCSEENYKWSCGLTRENSCVGCRCTVDKMSACLGNCDDTHKGWYNLWKLLESAAKIYYVHPELLARANYFASFK
jgi:hypothetical protein